MIYNSYTGLLRFLTKLKITDSNLIQEFKLSHLHRELDLIGTSFAKSMSYAKEEKEKKEK